MKTYPVLKLSQFYLFLHKKKEEAIVELFNKFLKMKYLDLQWTL